MAGIAIEQLSQLPEEMLRFTLLSGSREAGARLGNLVHQVRGPISTPHFIANTSRGTVPHITPDIYKKHTSIKGIYAALEDFVEKGPQQTPPIFNATATDGQILRRFIALQQDALLVLGARRITPVISPNANANNALAICTSVGFRLQNMQEFTSATQTLKPDIVIALGDIPYGNAKPSQKRREKMVDRTSNWVADIIQGRTGRDKTAPAPQYDIFAPILPIPLEQQTWYMEKLLEDMAPSISGLAIYDAHSVPELPSQLTELPRLSLEGASSPARILHEISLGMDLFIGNFVGEATDAGIALGFSFPAPASSSSPSSSRQHLGIDMWSTAHATSTTPLKAGCTCYACARHHPAYLQHLLSAKEMLAWVLLQVHNHAIMDAFFKGVRTSIAEGTFEQEKRRFEETYEAELPAQTGKGPRMRGYQFKSEGPGEPKKNEKARRLLNDRSERLAEAAPPDAKANATELEGIGFAEVSKS